MPIAGEGVVIAGETQPPEVHALVAQMNASLGNIRIRRSRLRRLYRCPANQIAFGDLVEEMHRGAVELLVVLGGNPLYDAPADFDFADAFDKVKLRVHHSVFFNETSRHSHWHVPATHFLESWSDTRAFDGSISIVQPLIEPMYVGVSAHEILESIAGRSPRSAYEILRSHWSGPQLLSDFESKWRRALSDGVVTELQPPSLTASGESTAPTLSASPLEKGDRSEVRGSQLEVLFRPDVSVRDGRYANNGWLQELPRRFSSLTWDNAALISSELAKSAGLNNGDIVELTFRDRKLRAPVWIQPGQAKNSVTLPLGYGREIVGRVGRNVGFNAYALRTSDALWFADGLTIQKTGDRHWLVSTQHHHDVTGRGILHDGTLAEFLADPHYAQKPEELPLFGLHAVRPIGISIQRIQMGHGGRSERLHRLPCLHHRLPGGK